MRDRYMIATKAIHMAGDISRDEPDLCYVTSEDDEAYIGHWVTGFGFQKVRFPKATTRDLTTEEQADYASRYIQLSNHKPVRIGINEDNSGAAR